MLSCLLMKSSPTTITVPAKLDIQTLDALYHQCLGCGAAPRRSRCVIDLTDTHFIDPGGLTGLAQAVAYLRVQGWSPSVRFPVDEVGYYLVRMGLRRALRGLGRCLGAPRGKRRYAASTALVEVSVIEGAQDVDALLLRLSDRVAGILGAELGYSRADAGNFCNVLSELCRNVIDHSGGVGFVAAQRYTRAQDGDRFAVISVGDVGVGLRSTLGQRYPVDSWSDVEILTRALLPTYSRHPNRGLGLAFVKKISSDYRGSLHMRSGSGRIYIRGNRLVNMGAAPFPGTQVVISLGQRDSGA